MTSNKSEFSVDIPIFDIKYKHLESENNNLFYLFNSQLDDILVHYFANLETSKHSIDKFLTN